MICPDRGTGNRVYVLGKHGCQIPIVHDPAGTGAGTIVFAAENKPAIAAALRDEMGNAGEEEGSMSGTVSVEFCPGATKGVVCYNPRVQNNAQRKGDVPV